MLIENANVQPLFTKQKLISLVIPLMIEQALARSVGMVDTMMVAHAGERVISGVSLVDSISSLLIHLFSALATGGAIVAGQYLGKKDMKNAQHAAKQLLLTSGLLSILIMLICLLFNQSILTLLFGNIGLEVKDHASSYFYVTAFSYPFIALFNSAAAIFRSTGDSKTSMYISLIMNIINLIGNSIFIYAMQMGAFGAGLATLLSRMFAASCILVLLRKPTLELSVRNYSVQNMDLRMVKRILKIGIPNGLENSIFQIGMIIVAGLVTTFGTSAMAANAIGNSLVGIAAIPGLALGMAMTTVVAQCIGANEIKQANDYIQYLLKLAFLFMFMVNIFLLAVNKPILSLYQLSDETRGLALQIMIITSVAAMAVWPFSFALPNAFRAAGDVKWPLCVSLLSMWLCRVGFSFVLAYVFHLGVLSVWLGMAADWVVRAGCFVWRWKGNKWSSQGII